MRLNPLARVFLATSSMRSWDFVRVDRQPYTAGGAAAAGAAAAPSAAAVADRFSFKRVRVTGRTDFAATRTKLARGSFSVGTEQAKRSRGHAVFDNCKQLLFGQYTHPTETVHTALVVEALPHAGPLHIAVFSPYDTFRYCSSTL